MQSSLRRIGQYKRLIDRDTKRYCSNLVGQIGREYTPYSAEALQAYCSLLQRGGKRLRGALVMNAYSMMGGQDKAVALAGARIIEMIHAYLLIIDDMCDRSDTRRGGPTAHRLLEELHREDKLHGDSAHFGQTIATLAAACGMHLAFNELFALEGVDEATKLKAAGALNRGLVTTFHGQINDVFNEAIQSVEEPQVNNVLTWKTAYYSFLSPMQFGAILAGIDAAELECLRDYSLHMGLAFQIIDDILGTFGDEKASGKSNVDDLREGKITILISYALQHCLPAEKVQLLQMLGDPNLEPVDYQTLKNIIVASGALAHAQELAASHAAQAKAALSRAPQNWNPEGIDFLQIVAKQVLERST